MTIQPRMIALWLGVAVVYTIGAKLGLLLAFEQSNTSPVWPPTGIAIAAMLHYGYRAAPGVLLGAFITNLMTSIPLLVAGSIAIGNTLEASIGFFLISRFVSRNPFLHAEHILQFTLFVALSSAISALCGVSSLLLADIIPPDAFKTLLLTWWLGDWVGGVIVTPFLILWLRPFNTELESANFAEAVIFVLITAIVCAVIFTPWFTFGASRSPSSFIFLPLAIWSAYRFLHRGATLFSISVSAIAIIGTIKGYGPFIVESVNSSLLLLQSFMGLLSISVLLLASSVKEKLIATAKLIATKNRLEHNVKSRTRDLVSSNQALSQESQERKNIIEALHTLLDSTALESYEQLVHTCIKDLASLYETRFAFIGIFTDKSHQAIKTIAVRVGNEFVDNFEYSLKGTPCQDVLNGTLEIIKSGAPQQYPEDHMLVTMSIDSYFGAPLVTPAGRTLGVLVVMHDAPIHIHSWSRPVLTLYANRLAVELEKDETEQEQQLAEKVFNSSIQCIAITDSSGLVKRANATFKNVTGYGEEESIKHSMCLFKKELNNIDTEDTCWETLTEKRSWQGEIWNRKKNGDTFPAWLSASSIQKNDDDTPSHFVWTFTDISEKKSSEDHIFQLAHYDSLTDLFNRTAFQKELDLAIASCLKNQSQLALIYLDLDHFKLINDASGHSAGDMLLQEVSRRLKQIANAQHTIGRLGGDEFVLILPNITCEEDITNLCEKIIDQLSIPAQLTTGVEVVVTTSLGISTYPKDGPDSHTLMKNADTAMYNAKKSGRNTYQFFTREMNEHAQERLTLENELRKALKQNEFELFYQPQINVATKELIGCEALIRWRHPDRGLVPPFEFIPVAEETGLIQPIGEWVIAEACRQQCEWKEQNIADIKIGVNISSRQFMSKNLLASIQESMANSGIAPEKLDLELTESAVMENVEEAIITLRALKNMGLSLSIDDFGTGYSSLSYLKQFPIDRLKIDRSFVQDIVTDADDAAIVTATISLSYNLHMAVVAEGVETEAQINFLKNKGCLEMQGFYFCKPLPAKEIAQFLSTKDIIHKPTTH
ncbi:MAG: EAL domain-containing protein [Agarilytica sp.]